VQILLKKAAHHSNIYVLKSCINNFLKLEVSFDEFEEVIYNTLIPILNDGVFYKDAEMTDDSKFTHKISKFFIS